MHDQPAGTVGGPQSLPGPPRAADVVMSERNVSHGAKLWRAEFPLMVAWAFGR